MNAVSPSPNPKPRRRWLQFSLRTLIVLMLLCGCGFGWLAFTIKRAREQGDAAKAVWELGGRVQYEPASGGLTRTVVAWVGNFLGEDLSKDVVWVHLMDIEVNDAELAPLERLTQLKQLYLAGTQVTDAGLTHLGGLSQLKQLDIGDTRVSDAGLVQLRGLTQLKFLNLMNTQVSDAGLTHLRGLTQLKLLELTNTRVSDAGINEFQKALPNVHIPPWWTRKHRPPQDRDQAAADGSELGTTGKAD